MKTKVVILYMLLVLNTTFDLMSTEQREQCDVSPCSSVHEEFTNLCHCLECIPDGFSDSWLCEAETMTEVRS